MTPQRARSFHRSSEYQSLESDGGRHEARGAGSLVLVSTPIGNLGDISPRATETLGAADLICCEDTRRTGLLLKLLGLPHKPLLSFHAHNEREREEEVVCRIRAGELVALVSDAGTPAISDPGERLVSRIIAEGLSITAVPGPTAAITALTLSGLPADRFAFEGFLPRKGVERQRKMEQIARSPVTVIIYESPLRVRATLHELGEACGVERQVAVARELTKLHEEIWRGTLGGARTREEVTSRGEHVIVVGPGEAQTSADAGDLETALRRLRASGLGTRDAVASVELLLGASHREAYRIALALDRAGE